MNQNVIKQLGGPTKVAQMLGLKDKYAVQRVSNWGKRGIPSKVLLDYPHVFVGALQGVKASNE